MTSPRPDNVLDIQVSARKYIDKLVSGDTSMKVLLVDSDTMANVSVVFTQTMLLERSIFLVDSVANPNRQPLKCLNCLMLIRPTPDSIRAACAELSDPKYSQYSIAFCNVVGSEQIEFLARSDRFEVVKRVEEYFIDFMAINSTLFNVPIWVPRGHPLVPMTFTNEHHVRTTQAITSVLLSLRRRPVIRYMAASPIAHRVAQDVAGAMRNDPGLYDFRNRDTVLLIVDRSSDPVTPLLLPWTYQAMMHEYLGLEKNRLKLPSDDPKTIGKDDEYVFCETDDPFYQKNMYNNWGELCENVKLYVDQCKTVMHIDRETATMEDIKNFMKKLPQAQQLTGSVTKHTNVVTHLGGVIKRRNLIQVSLLEQDLACENNASEHLKRLTEMLANPNLDERDAIRLAMLFDIRYHRNMTGTGPTKAEELLMKARINPAKVGLLRKLREYFASSKQNGDQLFGGGLVSSMMSAIKGFSDDVGNVLTQHEPLIKKMLTNLSQGKLNNEVYPYLTPPATSQMQALYKPKEVVVFVVGGATYEEAMAVHQHNAANPDACVVLGSTTMHTTSSFLAALAEHP